MFTETISPISLRKRLENLNGEENKLTAKGVDTIINLIGITKTGMLTFNESTFSWRNENGNTNIEIIPNK